jgi:peptidoglycan-associated lipoprotein
MLELKCYSSLDGVVAKAHFVESNLIKIAKIGVCKLALQKVAEKWVYLHKYKFPRKFGLIMKKSHLSLFSLVAVAFLAACSSTPKQADVSDNSGVSNKGAASVAPVVVPDHLDPNSSLSKNHSIYFDFDSFVVKSEYKSVIQQHGAYLVAHPALSIKVEGNADERGSREYNLALGQKRAEAAAKALKVVGVKESQVEAVSWGKEKPVATGHDEASWAKNRRDDITYNK